MWCVRRDETKGGAGGRKMVDPHDQVLQSSEDLTYLPTLFWITLSTGVEESDEGLTFRVSKL